MKIAGTRSYILVEFDHRTVKISGELTITLAFYASISSIQNRETPFYNLIVTDNEKREIVKRIKEEGSPLASRLYLRIRDASQLYKYGKRIFC